MGTILLIIFAVGAAHFCRLRGDNLAAAGFAVFALLLAFPGLLSAAFDMIASFFGDNSGLLGTLAGWMITIAVCVIGLRYVFSVRR